MSNFRMEEMTLNSYLYAPKDDYKHRLFWREKYSLDEAGEFSLPCMLAFTKNCYDNGIIFTNVLFFD